MGLGAWGGEEKGLHLAELEGGEFLPPRPSLSVSWNHMIFIFSVVY